MRRRIYIILFMLFCFCPIFTIIGCGSRTEGVDNMKAEKIWETDFDDIWDLEDKTDFIIALNGWICRKCNYGDEIAKLTDAEKTFYFVVQLESEVNNGGFSQFLFNSSGDFANDTSTALRKIGAEKTAQIYDKMLAAFGGKVPPDRDERIEMLDEILSDEINEILNECDDRFYEYSDDLAELNYQFVLNNKAQFTR